MRLEFDVAVVGGGIAGMSVAGELGRSLRVAVLEQEAQLAYHATGRSAAAFLESYGSPQIRVLTRASRATLDEGGLLRPRRLLWIADAGGVGEVEQLAASEPALRSISVAEARTYCPVLREDWLAAAAAEDGAQDLDVAALFERYRRLALANGVSILPRARVLAGAPATPGWRLDTAAGDVRAPIVINAAGAWADEVAGALDVAPVGLRALRRTVAIVTTPAADPSWPLVCDVRDGFYFRPEGADLLLSPVDETPSAPIDVRPDTVDVAMAIERVNEATTLGLRHVRTAWAGLRTFAPDRNPVLGPDPAYPGFWWLAGQGGYGMQTAPAMARLAAALIRGDRPPPDLADTVKSVSPQRFR